MICDVTQFGVHELHVYYWRIGPLCSTIAIGYVCLYCVHLSFTCVCLWSHFLCAPVMVAQFLCAWVTHWSLAHRSPSLCGRYWLCVFVLRLLNSYMRLFMVPFLVCTCDGCTFLNAWVTHYYWRIGRLCSVVAIDYVCLQQPTPTSDLQAFVYGRIFTVHKCSYTILCA